MMLQLMKRLLLRRMVRQLVRSKARIILRKRRLSLTRMILFVALVKMRLWTLMVPTFNFLAVSLCRKLRPKRRKRATT